MSENFKITTLYCFNRDIEDIYFCIKNYNLQGKIWIDSIQDFEYNQPKISVLSESIFTYTEEIIVHTVIENIIDQKNYKQIDYFAYKVFPINLQYRFMYKIYYDTTNKQTWFAIDIVYTEMNQVIAYYSNNQAASLQLGMQRLGEILDTININQYESIVLNTNINNIIKLLENLENLKLICPKFIDSIEKLNNMNNLEEYYLFTSKNLKTVYTVSKHIINKFKYELVLKSIKDNEIKDKIIFNLIRIGNNKCLLSIENNWKDSVKISFINKTKRNKRRLLKCLKLKFEN